MTKKFLYRLYRSLIGVVLIVVSVMISLVSLELCVRFFVQKPATLPMEIEVKVDNKKMTWSLIKSKDPIQVFELKPSRSNCIGGRCETINSHGFRGAEVNLADGSIFRIAMFGDSFTYGDGVDDDETLPVHLERILNYNGRREVQVLNFGVGGYNSAQVARSIRKIAIAYHPNIIIYNYFPNDAELYREEGNPLLYECAPMFAWKQPILKMAVSSHLIELISRRIGLRHMTRYGQDETYWNLIHHSLWPGWWVVKQAFVEMKKIEDEAGIFLYVTLIPFDDCPFVDKDGSFGKVVSFCNKLDIPIINVSDCFNHIEPYKDLWTTIGAPHYSNRGNEIVARNIFNQLITRPEIQKALLRD